MEEKVRQSIKLKPSGIAEHEKGSLVTQRTISIKTVFVSSLLLNRALNLPLIISSKFIWKFLLATNLFIIIYYEKNLVNETDIFLGDKAVLHWFQKRGMVKFHIELKGLSRPSGDHVFGIIRIIIKSAPYKKDLPLYQSFEYL